MSIWRNAPDGGFEQTSQKSRRSASDSGAISQSLITRNIDAAESGNQTAQSANNCDLPKPQAHFKLQSKNFIDLAPTISGLAS